MKSNIQKIRILHCITSLDPDGAQNMLLKICEQLTGPEFEMHVVNLRGPTPFAERFAALGIPVTHLCMPRGVPSPRALGELRKVVRQCQPHLIQGWMYHGNLCAFLSRIAANAPIPVVWNIRKAVEDLREYRFGTRVTLKIGAALSKRVAGTIYCGKAIAEQHHRLGYSEANQIIIPNGFDMGRFSPSAESGRVLREKLKLDPGAVLVGMTARYHPHKDHANFLHAASLLRMEFPDAHFVLAGRGLDDHNEEVKNLRTKLGLTNRLHLLGEQSEVESVLSALDIYCLSSSAEGFPNSLGEAMACGLPVVTTNAGSSAEVVGEDGWVVPTKNSAKLADALREALSLPRGERQLRGARARERVRAKFSLESISQQYSSVYSELTRHGERSNAIHQ